MTSDVTILFPTYVQYSPNPVHERGAGGITTPPELWSAPFLLAPGTYHIHGVIHFCGGSMGNGRDE